MSKKLDLTPLAESILAKFSNDKNKISKDDIEDMAKNLHRSIELLVKTDDLKVMENVTMLLLEEDEDLLEEYINIDDHSIAVVCNPDFLRRRMVYLYDKNYEDLIEMDYDKLISLMDKHNEESAFLFKNVKNNNPSSPTSPKSKDEKPIIFNGEEYTLDELNRRISNKKSTKNDDVFSVAELKELCRVLKVKQGNKSAMVTALRNKLGLSEEQAPISPRH